MQWRQLFRPSSFSGPQSTGKSRVHAVLPPAALDRLTQQVTASEQQHTGEIRVCIEARMPASYLERSANSRERAVNLFGKLRVWDTEDNNGVLIYLLLSDHAIEIVADRGLNQCVTAREWSGLTQRLAGSLRSQAFEKGLSAAVEEVSTLLSTHFPSLPGTRRLNALPDRPVVLD